MKKIMDYFTRLLPVWTVAAGILGYFYPATLVPLKGHIEWLFMLTMLGIGTVLNYEDFLPIFKRPHIALLGTFTQFAVMPLLGFTIARILNLSPALTLGLVLVGSVPGAMASNVISYLAKADVAYSISVTSTSTFLAPLLTPLFIYLFAHTIIEIQFWPMFFSIVKMVIVPLLAGLFIKRHFKRFLEKFSNIAPAFSTVFIALICGLIVALNRDHLLSVSTLVFVAVFWHNLLGLASGYGAARLYGFEAKRRRALSIEVGMQNAGLGAVLALKHFSADVCYSACAFCHVVRDNSIYTCRVLEVIWVR